jgi:hypothetical protein
MNEQEAIAYAEAWYLRRYHTAAQGHITLDTQGCELREQNLVCLDLVPTQGAGVVNVVVDLTSMGKLNLLDEGVLCPRCLQQAAGRR